MTGSRDASVDASQISARGNGQVASLAVNSELRPFVSFAAGPYIHDIDDASGLAGAHASLQTVIGARLGAGANWYLWRHFALQVEGDYHGVPAFDAVDGVSRNASGFALSVGFGVAWGGAK